MLITGKIGAGKSLVCQFLEELGLIYFNSDKIVASLYDNNKALEQKLVKTFGQEILIHGKISKARLSEVVFQDKEKLKFLQDYIHPRVRAKLKETIETSISNKSAHLLVEMPLIQTAIFDEINIDATIIVESDRLLRQKRWIDKGFSQQGFTLRESHQSEDFFKTQKRYVITNNGSIKDLQKLVLNLFNKINTI